MEFGTVTIIALIENAICFLQSSLIVKNAGYTGEFRRGKIAGHFSGFLPRHGGVATIGVAARRRSFHVGKFGWFGGGAPIVTRRRDRRHVRRQR